MDIVRRLRDASSLPIAAYQVSGEYAMIKAAAARVFVLFLTHLPNGHAGMVRREKGCIRKSPLL